MGYTGQRKLEYGRTWQAARRAEWVTANGPCAACGSNEQLEVDHIDPAKKEIAAGRLWTMARTNPKRVAELAKCQVLCHSCHVAKTKRQRVVEACPSRGAYKRGCGCDGCKDANAEYQANRRGNGRREGASGNVRPRVKRGPLTACKRGHEFNSENTRINRNGCRACRVCERQRKYATYQTRKRQGQ
jgi:hypothetical protein